MNNKQDILAIDPKAKVRRVKKGQVLLRKGDEWSPTFYVEKGLLRSYLVDTKGKEHIFLFAPEGWVIADVESLEFRQSATLYIDCLEDSEVVEFDKNAIAELKLPREALLGNIQLLYRRLAMLQHRVMMQMSAPAADRYAYFMELYPQLSKRVPQYMIASYLGITPQALSTLRGRF
ncbi:MAG: Crp/Fnr family transcriptional regulator [Bacteroidota bacterium]